MGLLITPDELRTLIDTGHPLTLLDVRWRLDRPDGRAEYSQGRVPGAVYVDLEEELAERGRPAAEGRHPLPSSERLQAAARRWGLQEGDVVVVYDDVQNTASARAWWLLRRAGVADVRILDGALQGWTDAGCGLATGESTPEPSAITLNDEELQTLDIEAAAVFPSQGTLVDARAEERYRGEAEPLDPRAGHIPGALSIPTSGNVDESGRFLSPEQLRERFLQLGVDPEKPVASYCGSGVSAAHEIAALELAGFDAALYPGSFSQWSNHPERPVATGGQPE